MKLDFVQHGKRNMVAAFLNSGIRLLFPFLNRTLFLWLLGPAYLGLNGLFGSVLGMLSLAELGFGLAVIPSMYKPVAEDDKPLIRAYLAFHRSMYRRVGAAVLLAGLCLMPFLRRLVHGSVPPGVDLHLLFLIHLLNTAASYSFFAYRGSVLGAYARKDVMSHLATGVSLVQYVTVFFLLLLTRSYYAYVLSTVAFTAVQNVLLLVASRKLFPDIEPSGRLPDELRRRVLSDVKSIVLHKIGGFVTVSADNLVVSAFLGLVAVAAYGNYYYVVSSVGGLVCVVYNSLRGPFGNKIHTESKEENFKLFLKTCRLSGIAILWCSAMMAALFQPFIALWTKHDPSLLLHALTPVLMVLFFFVNQSRQTLLTFKSAAAIWWPDRWKPIVAGAVNLALNISFILFLPEEYKLDGVILSTIVGHLLIQIPWETRVVFTHFFDRRQERMYWRMQARLAALGLVLCTAAWFGTAAIPLDGFGGLAAKGAATAVLAGGVLLALFRSDALGVVDALRRKKR